MGPAAGAGLPEASESANMVRRSRLITLCPPFGGAANFKAPVLAIPCDIVESPDCVLLGMLLELRS